MTGDTTAPEAVGSRSAAVSVTYRFVDGYHVFTSDEVRGLYVASKDAADAYRMVAIVLGELVQEMTGKPCSVEPTLNFFEFIAEVSAARGADGSNPRPRPLGPRSYVVREKRAA